MKPGLRLMLWLACVSGGCGRFGFDTLHDSEPRPRPSAGFDGGANGTSADAGVPDVTARDGSAPPATDASCTGCASSEGGSPASDGGPRDGAVAITAPTVTWTSDTNLSFVNTPAHSCAEGGDMVSYAVTGLVADSATLDHAPDAGCLVQGDEVLLISLQGVGSATTNVGQYELLRVASVQGSTLLFADPKQLSYGDASSDDNLGTGPGQHRVVVQRVPTYGNATVASGATVRAYAWDGVRGGVLAMRVQGELRVDGSIDMSGAGYLGGAPTDAVSSTGQQGESLGGLGLADINANQGGGGGGLGDGMGCRQSGSGGGGAGHNRSGAAGIVPDCSAVGGGAAGAQLGDLSRLLLGSGGGAGGTDNVRTDNPPGGQGGEGGGAILLFADALSGTGSVAARGTPGQGDAPGVECNGGSNVSCWDHSGPGGGGAGGTIRIESRSLAASLTPLVAAGRGGNGNDALAGNGGAGSPGRIVQIDSSPAP